MTDAYRWCDDHCVVRSIPRVYEKLPSSRWWARCGGTHYTHDMIADIPMTDRIPSRPWEMRSIFHTLEEATSSRPFVICPTDAFVKQYNDVLRDGSFDKFNLEHYARLLPMTHEVLESHIRTITYILPSLEEHKRPYVDSDICSIIVANLPF